MPGGKVVSPERIAQIAERHAPWLPYRRVAARQRDVTQMRPPHESRKVGDQKFPAPDFSIGAVAGTVEGHANHLAAEVIFRHATGNVRMMMLHADFSFQRQFQREARAHVVGMQVVRHRPRFNPEKLLQVRQRFLEEHQRLVILQIANVLTQNCVGALGQAKRVLQLGAAGQDLASGMPRSTGCGTYPRERRSTRSRPSSYAHHGIIGSHVDIAVVKYKPVGHRLQTLPRLLIRGDNWLLADVAAGHHQGRELRRLVGRVAEQQVMKRRVGQHDANGVIARSDCRGNIRVRSAAQHNDRPSWAEQRSAFRVRNDAEAFDGGNIARHQGERLIAAAFAGPQQLHAGIVLRIAGQQKSA